MKDGTLNAVFDEALMTLPWKQIADSVDLTFLPVDQDVLQALDKKYGIRSTKIPKGSLRGIDRDLPCIDFAGWIFSLFGVWKLQHSELSMPGAKRCLLICAGSL